MRRSTWIGFAVATALAIAANSKAIAAEPAAKTPTKAEREKQFEDSMHNVVMSGHYTKGDIESGKDLPEDH